MKQRQHYQFKYLDIITVIFVTVLLVSNLVSATKICQVGGYTFGSGILFFPMSYLFGDILTEVYGYGPARRVIWSGFGAIVFATLMSTIVLRLPAAPDWPNQEALETIFGATPRVVMASILAFFFGEFCNSYTLAKMKIITKGKYLWSRTIGSTVVGEAVDSVIFYPLAFLGIWTTEQVITVMWSNYLLKVLWEVLMTPVTYRVVAWLKHAESYDYFDRDTDFSPFHISK